MADEPTQDPAIEQDTPAQDATQDTPEAEAPEQSEQQTQAEIDYEKRYQDLQPEYTRATQEAAQYRQIIELAQQGDPDALEILGLEAADEDTEDDGLPPIQTSASTASSSSSSRCRRPARRKTPRRLS